MKIFHEEQIYQSFHVAINSQISATFNINLPSFGLPSAFFILTLRLVLISSSRKRSKRHLIVKKNQAISTKTYGTCPPKVAIVKKANGYQQELMVLNVITNHIIEVVN